MKIDFKNGSKVNSIYVDKNTNIRGNRSKIIGCNCYDTETNTWTFHEIDLGNQIGRYIPEWCIQGYMTNKETENE